jgi:hypothetical protein
MPCGEARSDRLQHLPAQDAPRLVLQRPGVTQSKLRRSSLLADARLSTSGLSAMIVTTRPRPGRLDPVFTSLNYIVCEDIELTENDERVIGNTW